MDDSSEKKNDEDDSVEDDSVEMFKRKMPHLP